MNKNFSSIGKEVIQSEINALKKLKKSLNKDFDKIVNLILKCKGKVIFSGVGKSGIISKKIAWTHFFGKMISFFFKIIFYFLFFLKIQNLNTN